MAGRPRVVQNITDPRVTMQVRTSTRERIVFLAAQLRLKMKSPVSYDDVVAELLQATDNGNAILEKGG